MKNYSIKYFVFVIIIVSSVWSCNETDKRKSPQNKINDKDTCIGKVSMHLKKQKLKFADLQKKEDTTLVFNKNKYIVLPKQSQLEWFCGKHTGMVLLKEGTLQVKDNQPVSGRFVVQMDSIHDTDIENNLMRGTLENVLRSKDFFDVKNYPESIFTITDIIHQKGNVFQINGNLKIKNAEKNISFEAVFDIMRDTLSAQSEKFVINRTDWGIIHMSKSHAKSDDEFVFTDSLQFVVHLKAI